MEKIVVGPSCKGAVELDAPVIDNLKNIAQRKLTPDQQDMVRQINSYMEQSHSAIKEGDLGRARSLADKARMLCDALARQ